MGNYFTSMQIYDKEKMSQEQFIDKLCKRICDEGYVVCCSDESELSYILKFADNCQWVTIMSEDYKDDMDLPRKDVVRIAKMLGTACVQTTVIDSDCAVMELYDAKGEQADMFVIGRADDYFGDNIPQPKESIWKPFLTEGSSWDEFNNIKNGDFVFVEDGLSELAPAIGMNSRNLVLEADEAVEDEQTVFLYFRKADAKKEKKLTLNAAFKQVFGEALEPLGFVKIKSKHPYYVRVVNGEILNIITFNKDYKTEFSVFGGIATLYRIKLDFDQNVLNNLKALNDTAQFYYYGGFAGSPQSFFKRSYSFSPDDSSSVKQAFLEAVSHTKQYIIPVMDNIASLRDCVGHFMIYQSPIMNIIPEEDDQFGDNESLLYFKIDDHSDMTHEFTQYLACHKSFNDYNTLFKHSEEYRKELIQKRDAIYNNNEQYQRIISEISSRKKANIEKLQQYGLSI